MNTKIASAHNSAPFGVMFGRSSNLLKHFSQNRLLSEGDIQQAYTKVRECMQFGKKEFGPKMANGPILAQISKMA
jgi:hypothetical protein